MTRVLLPPEHHSYMEDQSSTPLHDLPVELVRTVFEFGASQSKSTAMNLVRVSKTVREWITPLLYETVRLQSPRSASFFYGTIQMAKSGYAAHVRTLYLADLSSPGLSPTFLTNSNFPALQYLAINSSSLRVRSPPSLHCSSPRLTSITITGRLWRISYEHPIFQNCTHLYLPDDVPMPFSLTSDMFPCLTHLACGYRDGYSSSIAITYLPVLLPRKSGNAYVHPDSQVLQPPSNQTYPVALEVLVVETYLSKGSPDAITFAMECLGLGKKASESGLQADPRLVLRPGTPFNSEWWKDYVVSDTLWTTAERDIRARSVMNTPA